MPSLANTDKSFEQPPEEVISTTPCPMCLAGGKTNPLRNRAGKFETYCSAGHTWSDTEQLNFMIAQAKQINPKAFPEKAVTKEPEPLEFFIVDPDNKKAIEGLIGQTITGAAELKGVIWTLQTQAREAHEALTQLKTKTLAGQMAAGLPLPTGSDKFTLTIPEYLVGTIEEHANHEQKPVQTYLQEQFAAFLESYYSPLAAYSAQQGR